MIEKPTPEIIMGNSEDFASEDADVEFEQMDDNDKSVRQSIIKINDI